MYQKRPRGFSLMEALLSMVVIVAAGLGVYGMFNSSRDNERLAELSDELIEIGNVYTDLASSDLTSGVNNQTTVVPILKSSGRLSTKYFTSSETSMLSSFGALSFLESSPYTFTIKIPVGCLSEETVTSNASVSAQIFAKVRDLYSCKDGEKTYSATNCDVTTCSDGQGSTMTLYFSINE